MTSKQRSRSARKIQIGSMHGEVDQVWTNILVAEIKYSLDIIRHTTNTNHSLNATKPGIAGPLQAIDQQDNVFPWTIATFLWYPGRYSLVWTHSTFPHETLSKLPHQGDAGIGLDSPIMNSKYPFFFEINVTLNLHFIHTPYIPSCSNFLPEL